MILLAILYGAFLPLQAEYWYGMPAEAFFQLPAVQETINASSPNYELLSAAIFHATNQARKAEGLSALSHEKPLTQAANLHAENMRKERFFAHKDPGNKRLRTPKLRIEKYSSDFRAFGENIARFAVYKLDEKGTFFVTPKGELVDENNEALKAETYSKLARKIVEGWMNSPGHRENLLGNYNSLGIGLSRIFSENKNHIPEILITQNFGLK